MARRKKEETPEEIAKREADLERYAKRSAEINTWKPRKSEEVITESDGNIFIVNFDKVFKGPTDVKKYNNFCVKKSSYEEHLKTFSRYINYFINKYDPENELVTAYFNLKYNLDCRHLFTKDNPNALIEMIYDKIFTPSICEKIRRMVHDNYLDDIEKPSDDEYKQASDKKYLESLEFKNKHIEILLRISTAQKIIVPVMYHYFTINHIKPDELTAKKDISIVYDFFEPTFGLFEDDVNMFNKLYVYIKRKVIDSCFHNEKIFKQREIFGDDPGLLIEKFVKKQLISENIVKYHFNEVWDPKKKKYKENLIGLNKTIIKYKLLIFVKEIYSKTLTEMTNVRDADGLSASDKMEMKLTKMDKGVIILSEVNIKDTLRRLSENGIVISDDEVNYYLDHCIKSDIQTQMLRSINSKEFMSYRDQYIVPRRQTQMLTLLTKKKLLVQSMCNPNRKYERPVLPFILTGNVSGKVNTRMVRNSKLLAKIEDDSDYQYLVNYKYKEMEELHPGYIKGILSTFIYTKFTYVTYEEPEKTGLEIEAPEDQICHEVIQFLKMI